MLLSIVIVNWNSRDDLRDCLNSLREQTHRELEIIVVDNASTDGSVQLMTSEFSHFRLIRQSGNLGFAEGCNRGIDASKGEWVAMLNNDTIADPGWSAALVKAAENAPPKCGMLQSLLLFLDRPYVTNATGIELTHRGGGRDRDANRPRDLAMRAPQDVFCVTAGAAAYRRTMLKAVRLSSGYFDRNHFLYFEDLDLGWRARLAGWHAQYVPDAIVYHKWHGSTARHGPSWLAVTGGINRLRTLIKNASPMLLLKTVPFSIAWLGEIVRHGGFGALGRAVGAIRLSAELRNEVSAMIRVDRTALERQWTVKK